MNSTIANSSSTIDIPAVTSKSDSSLPHEPKEGRCQHMFPNGKRCRKFASGSHLGLCLQHLTERANDWPEPEDGSGIRGPACYRRAVLAGAAPASVRKHSHDHLFRGPKGRRLPSQCFYGQAIPGCPLPRGTGLPRCHEKTFMATTANTRAMVRRAKNRTGVLQA